MSTKKNPAFEKHLQETLKTIRECWVHTAHDHFSRMIVVKSHLEILQKKLGLSNTEMKSLLRSQGINLVTGEAHGKRELKKMLKHRMYRVPFKHRKVLSKYL